MAKKKTDVIDSGQEIVKQKRKPAGMAAALAGDLGQEPGDNTRIVQTNMKFFDMPRVDLNNPEEVHERLCEYFKIYGEADALVNAKNSTFGFSFATRIMPARYAPFTISPETCQRKKRCSFTAAEISEK